MDRAEQEAFDGMMHSLKGVIQELGGLADRMLGDLDKKTKDEIIEVFRSWPDSQIDFFLNKIALPSEAYTICAAIKAVKDEREKTKKATMK